MTDDQQLTNNKVDALKLFRFSTEIDEISATTTTINRI